MKDPLVEISSVIRAAREQSGLSLEELAEKSRVSLHHIENIEKANREQLPEEAYLIGFLNKLLRALKVKEASSLLDTFRKVEGDFIVQSLVNTNDPEHDSAEDETSYFKIYHLYVLLGVVLLILTWFVINSANKDSEVLLKNKTIKQKHKAAQAELVSETPIQQSTEITQAAQEEELPPEEEKIVYKSTTYRGKGNKTVRVRVKEVAWIQVIGVDDGKILYEGDVYPTQEPNQFSFSDNDGFVIATGNAGAIEVSTSDDGTFTLGPSGQVTKWFYPKSAKKRYERQQKKNARNSKYKEQELVRID